jgi:DNA-binding LacI/PurR family transcriptional regulator
VRRPRSGLSAKSSGSIIAEQANARNLRAQQQPSIGMIIIDASPFFLADHFTCQVVAGLANVLNQADYTLTLACEETNSTIR